MDISVDNLISVEISQEKEKKRKYWCFTSSPQQTLSTMLAAYPLSF